MRKLTIGSCFSGIGGIELGLEWTGGFETKWQIENDPYATKVLEKHWPNVKRYQDIRDVVRPEPVDLICGGFPCQDVSLAGKREGLEGKRSTLWGEMFRLICEVKPRWVVAENVPGLLSSDNGRFFGNILRDLAGIRYDAEWGLFSACSVRAPHSRERLFIVAHLDIKRLERAKRSRMCCKGGPAIGTPTQDEGNSRKWPTEPIVVRVAHGIPSRVDRLKCLGNAVVPQVAKKIGEMIIAYENKT